MQIILGTLQAATNGQTLIGEVSFVDGASQVQTVVGAALSVYPIGSATATSATATITAIGSSKTYKLTVTTVDTSLAAGSYSVRFTAGNVGSGDNAIPLTDTVVASFGATASGLPGADLSSLQVPTYTSQKFTLGTCTGGTFTLTIQGQTTGAIAFDATASDDSSTTSVQTAIRALTGMSGVTVTGTNPGPFTLDLSSLAESAAAITVDASGLYNGPGTATMTWFNDHNITLDLPNGPFVGGDTQVYFTRSGIEVDVMLYGSSMTDLSSAISHITSQFAAAIGETPTVTGNFLSFTIETVTATTESPVGTNSSTLTFPVSASVNSGPVTYLPGARLAAVQDLYAPSKPGTAQTITANQSVNVAQWGGAALPTIPGAAPTVAQIATAIFKDLTAGGDFDTAGSIGLLLINLAKAAGAKATAAATIAAGAAGGLLLSNGNNKAPETPNTTNLPASPASSGDVSAVPGAVAAAILVNPTNKLATATGGGVTLADTQTGTWAQGVLTSISGLGSSISGWFATLWSSISGAFTTLGTAVGLCATHVDALMIEEQIAAIGGTLANGTVAALPTPSVDGFTPVGGMPSEVPAGGLVLVNGQQVIYKLVAGTFSLVWLQGQTPFAPTVGATWSVSPLVYTANPAMQLTIGGANVQIGRG